VTADELVTRAQHGDHAAFEQIAKDAVGRLYRTASLILRDSAAADDAVQDALISVWKSLPTLRETAAFDGWMNRILVRSCYRAIGRRLRRLEVQVIEIDHAIASDEERVDMIDQIERAFRRLTPEHRAVLVLHHRLGLTTDEAAQTLGIAAGTAKSRLNRATSALRAALEAEDRGAPLMRGHTT
jgi:RNA polymerase sigma-70 factor, ECF subfamily